MTTKDTFLNKIFSEGERAKPFYANYDFSEFRPEEKDFLKRLGFLSKYKNTIKRLLIKRKIKDTDRQAYVDNYKSSLTYNEYIQYNIMMEKIEASYINTLYIMGGIIFSGFLFYVIRKPSGASIFKEMFGVGLLSLLGGFGYYKWNKLSYSEDLSTLYKNIEERLNKNPSLKLNTHNPNILTEEKLSPDDYEED
jgi:hypothetical protein